MMSPDKLRAAVHLSRMPVSQIADAAGVARSTLYSFMSGATGTLRASAHNAVERATTGDNHLVAEERTEFSHANLTIDPALLEEAASYGLDAADIARRAVEREVKTERMKRFSDDNREAIESWNEHYRKHGLWSDGYRLF